MFSLTEIVARQSTLEVIFSYIQIGFEHIVPKGTDHILFILGLVFVIDSPASVVMAGDHVYHRAYHHAGFSDA